MKAIIIKEFGGPEVLEPADIPEPELGLDDLLVQVKATAVNRADLLQRQGRYPAPPGTRSDVPGLEFAGTVEATGTRQIRYQRGQRVMGLLPGGGYAERVVVHADLAIPIPDRLTFEQAAAVPEAYATAYDALFLQMGLSVGESVLIHAVGSGVGVAALQMAKQAGATVFGTAGSDEKLKKAGDLGLDFGINYRTGDFEQTITERTGKRGVEVILDLVGAAHWPKNLTSLAIGGRMIVVGLTGGAKAETNLAVILNRRLKVVGTVLRSRSLHEKMKVTAAFERQIVPLLASGAMEPIIDRVYNLEQAAEAHDYVSKNLNFGKVVLRVGS